MKCQVCGSQEQRKFPAEVVINFPGVENLKESPVLVFPQLLICIHCGRAEFAMPEAELRLLARANAAVAR